uniref:CD68 molecule n=1 Tax=Monopterus albus TaxID=43700 RepID=A0A3Q3K6W9_MONAL|nr:macrosialin [Monopterus albus]
MKRVVVFFIACWAVSALSLAEEKTNSKPSATVSPADEFSSATVTPTKAATTSKAKPTTTPKPPITTTAPPGPTPPAKLTVGNYSITDQQKTCLLAQLALQIRISKENGTFTVQPDSTTAKGFCKESTANLTLLFKEGNITFLFNKSIADNTVYVYNLSFNLFYAFSKGEKKMYSAHNATLHLFAAKIGQCYSCKSDSIHMGEGMYLDVTQDRMQAFNLTKSGDFGSPNYCPADQPNYRIAIAVGVVLLVLIIVVVVAYLLSRRKRTAGYQSL